MNCMQIAFQPGNWPDTIAISLNDFRANKFPLCQTNARSHTHMDRHTHTHVGRHMKSGFMCDVHCKTEAETDSRST